MTKKLDAVKASVILDNELSGGVADAFKNTAVAAATVGFNGQTEQVGVIAKNLNRYKKVETKVTKVVDSARKRYSEAQRRIRVAKTEAKANASGSKIITDAQRLDSSVDAATSVIHRFIAPTVRKATQSLKSVSSEWWTRFSKHPKLAFAAGSLIGGVAAFNLIRGAFSRTDRDDLAIPKHYRRGYDLINEYTSDFGSPVKASVVTRVLSPYASSTRRGTIKSVDSVTRSNVALVAHTNAIGHRRY